LLDAALAVPFDPEEEDRRQLALARSASWDSGPVSPSVVDIAPEPAFVPDPLVADADAAMGLPPAPVSDELEPALPTEDGGSGGPALPQADEDLPPLAPAPSADQRSQISNLKQGGGRRSASALLAEVLPEATAAEQRTAGPAVPTGGTRRRSAAALLADVPEDSGVLRRAADVPIFIAQGITTGLKGLTDAFGADNAASQALAANQDFYQAQLSPEAQASQQRVAQIQAAAADQGVMAQLGAAGRAFAESPTAFVAQGVGTMAPTIALGAAGKAVGLGARGVQAVQTATGATMGGGIVKGEIYQAVEQAMLQAGRSPEEAAEAASTAQAYGGENLDQILAGYGLGALATAIGAERLAGRAIAGAAAPTGGVLRVAGRTALQEALPEAAQGGQEQLARNLAQQREDFNVPTMRGVVGAGALEGLAGLAIGGPAGVAAGAGAAAGRRTAGPAVPTGEAAAAAAAPAPVRRVVVEADDVFGEATTAAVDEPVAAAAAGDERFAPAPAAEQRRVNFAMPDDMGTAPAADMGADVFAGVPQQQAPVQQPTGPLEQGELMSVPRQVAPPMQALRSRLDVVDAELNDLTFKPELTPEEEGRFELLNRQKEIFERALTRREQEAMTPRATTAAVVETPAPAAPSLVDYAKQKLTERGRPVLAEAITTEKAAQSFRAQYERDFPQAARQPAAPEALQSMGQDAPEAAPVTVEDFGEEIPAARKHMAQPLGPRTGTAKPQDERPTWLRKYVAGQRLYTRFNAPRPELVGQETGKWTLMRTDGSALRSPDFDTEAEAMAAVPMVEVSRNHVIRAQTKPDGTREYVIQRRVSDRKFPVVKGGFASQEEATQYLASNPQEIIEHKLPFPQRPWLDNLQRVGGTERKGNVAPKNFQETFGFRGGQFGNWNMGGDGQEALNFAYDALLDLADVLQVPPKALSLNGELAIAFGARGRGGAQAAAAHYEPDYVVINLTKINGAGTLAHEWFHALDHFLGKQDEALARFKTGKSKLYASYGLSTKSDLPDVLRERFEAVMKSLTVANKEIPLSATAEQDKVTRTVANLQQDVGRIRQSMEQYANFRKRPAPTAKQLAEFDALAEKLQTGQPGAKTYITPKNARRMSVGYESFEVIDQLNALYKKVTGSSFLRADSSSPGRQLVWSVDNLQRVMQRVEAAQGEATETRRMATEYLKEARKIDQNRASNYWSEPEEMGARSFEAFVADKLAASERRNDYLVSGVDNDAYKLTGFKPYPEGEERQTINAAWQDVWDAVRETAPDLQRDQLRKKIANKLQGVTSQTGAVDLSIVADLAEYGRAAFWNGMSYAQWAGRMVREFGQGVAQFLRQAFDRIVAAYRDSRFSDTTGAVGDVRPRQMKPRQLEEKAMRNEALAAETRARLGSEYLPISLNAQAEAAKEWINTNGLDAAKLRIAQLSGEDSVPTPLDFAIGIEAAGRLSAVGDHQGAADIVSTMSHRATGMGQTISTLAMMARLSPEGIVFYGENIIRRYINALPPEAQERIRALQAEVARLKAELAKAKFDQGSEVIRSGKLGDEKIQDRIKRRQRAKVTADLGPAASGPEVTAETRARVIRMNVAVRDVLLGDSTKAEATKAIEAILLEQGNLSAAEAAAMAKSIADAFFKLMRETRTRLTNEAKGRGGRAGGFDRLLAALREGKDISDADFLGEISRLMGLPGMTPAMARELRAIGQRYERATDPDVRLVLAAQMYEKAHELVPADFWVKVRGFAYLSMLFAPKTWIRNVVGNQIQWIANVGRDAFVTGLLDPAMSMFTGQRTSAGLQLGARLKGLLAPVADVRRGYLWSKQENPSFNFRQNVAAGVNHLRLLSKLSSQNKYEISDVRTVNGRIFSGPPATGFAAGARNKLMSFMTLWEAALSIALGAGDRAFWMSQFKASMAQMQAAAEKNGEWSGQPTPEMIEAAMAEAAYAIYQNPNLLSQGGAKLRGVLNRWTTAGRTDQFGLGTALMAFTQVPGSIALRGILDWSPVGFIRAMYQGMRGVLYASSEGRRGAKFDQAEFNKTFTQALLGTGGMYAAGFWLYSLGIITASREDDEDLEAMRRASGLGSYRINLTALRRALLSMNWFTPQPPQDGDMIVTYDWAQPVAITVAAGAEYAAMLERAERSALKKGLAERASMPVMSLVAGAKSLEELPLLSGLMSFMQAAGQRAPAGESSLANAVIKTVTGLPSMFVPQLVRQATQLSDNMIRTTRAGVAAEREFDRVLASLPGWSTKYPVRFDVTGQAIERYQYGGNTVWNVLTNPTMTTRYKADPVLQEVGRLLNATGEAGVVPREVLRKTKINGLDVELTNNQIAAYQYYVGNFTMSHFRWRMAAPVYARLPDELKAKMLSDDLKDIHAAVKSAVLGADARRLTRRQMFLRQALVNSPLGRSVPPR
jgi:hypothetical protein